MDFLKKSFIYILIFLICVYLLLYLGLPYILNKKDYSHTITNTIKQQTGLILVIHNYKLSVSPLLEVNLKADEIQAFYPDKKQFLNVKKAEIDISSLNLLKKEIKFNKVKADEFQFSTKLLKNGKTTFQEYIEKNIKQSNQEFLFSNILPQFKVNKYIIKIKDEESGQKFKISGSNFKVLQNLDLRYIDISSEGALYCFEKEYVNYKLKISVPKNLFKDVNKILFDISFDNLHKQDFHAYLTSDLKIHTHKDKFDYLSGKIDIDKFTMKLGSQKLPPSYFHINLDKGRAAVVSKFYTNHNELTDINANVKITKPYEIDMKCKCQKADISNLQKLVISVFELLKIKNNLSEFKALGTLSSDFILKTNMKTIHSQGELNIKNAQISHKSIPLQITGINALLDFSNDTVNIKQSDLLVNKQPLKIKGIIHSDTRGDVTINANNLDLNHIMNAFPMLKPQKNLTIKSGKLSFDAKLKGKLTEATPQINAIITNFSAFEAINKITVSVKEITINALTTKKSYSGKITLKNLLCKCKNISNTIHSEIISAEFDDKNLTIKPSRINTGNAKITLEGAVKNYSKTPDATIIAKGNIDTDFLKSLVNNKQIPLYAKGYLPLKLIVKATEKEALFDVRLLANPSNYITPVHINNFLKTNTLTHISGKTDFNNFKIDEISIYYAHGINSLINDINLLTLKKALLIKGKVKNINRTPEFDNIKIQTTDNLSIAIPEIKGAKADINTDITLNGNEKNPIIDGLINISNLDVPQYFVKAQSAAVLLNKNQITAKIDSLKIKNMDISIETIIPSDILTSNKINYVKIDAQYLDMDYLMSLMPLLTQASYSPGIEFPYTISNGKLFIKSYKMGNIKAQNITADISSQKNILYLKNLFATAYGGKAAGHITYNFPYSSIKADIQGRGMDAASGAKDLMPKEQQVSGRLNFDASINMYGTTPEQQMKSLKGRADVMIQNGHVGQLGRFEHFLYAQNLLSQKLIFASLNSAKQAISPKDTGYFTYLKGMLKFNNGYVYLNPVLTAGPQMSMYITGNLNLLTNEADMQILGRISSEVSSSLGLLGTMTIKDFLDEHTKYGQNISSLFNFCNSELPEIDISKIPELNPNYRYETKNFRVLIIGNTESVKSVKSFTWVNPIGTKQKALREKVEEAINKVLTAPQNTQQSQPAPQPQQYMTTPQQPVVQSRPMQTTPNPKTVPASFLDTIPDNFK